MALGNLTIDGDGIGSDDDTASVTVSVDSGDDGTRDVQVFRFYETSVYVSLYGPDRSRRHDDGAGRERRVGGGHP